MKKTSPKNKIDELLEKLETAMEDAEKVDILSCLAGELLYSNPKEAKKYAEEGLEIAKSIDFEKGIGYCQRFIGIIYHVHADYPLALEYLHKSLEIAESLGDRDGISKCLNNIALVHRAQGDYSQALEYLFKSREIREELSDKKGICICLTNIGTVYWYQEDYSQALDCFRKALEIAEELDDKNAISACLSGIGIIHRIQGNYPESLKYNKRSLEIAKQLKDRKAISRSQINIGNIYIETEENDKAIDYLTKGLNLAIEIDALDWQKNAYKGLSMAYANSRKYKKALEYYMLFNETGDVIFNQEKSKQIADMRTKYETEKKEQEIEIWKQASITDPLTKIPNRMGLWDKIRSEIKRFSLDKKPFVVSILDIDKFKLFNDEHGHDCGDSVLQAIADILNTSTRDEDYVGRWGGEEFLIIVPEIDLDGGLEIVERVRKAVEDYVHHFKGKSHSITASFGLSAYLGDKDIDKVIKEADEALYSAKMSGRNRCVAAGQA